ncbi:MAG: S-layer homology domain-containing protein [Clostridia bacterium]|nr:S-layer homology domain-containing protein [Clostridia bacterium]
MTGSCIFKKFVAAIVCTAMLAPCGVMKAAAAPVEKSPSCDTYVTKSSGSNSVYSYEHLESSADTWTYLAFDMSDIKYLNYKATLSFTLKNVVSSGGKANAGVYGLSEHDWTPGSLSGASRPTPMQKLGELELEAGTRAELDVTTYVRQNISKRGNIAFVVLQDDSAGKTIVLYSSESGKGPVLTIDRDGYDAEIYEKEPTEPVEMYTVAAESSAGADYETEPLSASWEELSYYVPEPDISGIGNIDIDSLTTTRTAPWMVNYHLTKIAQAQNGYAGGECGQFMFCIDVAPTDSQKMILGLDTCGMFRSENGGKSWSDASGGFKSMGTIDIRYDPDNADIVYVAACPHSGSDAYNQFSGIWKSTDGGKNWRQLNDFQFPNLYNGYVIDFGEPNENGSRTIYVGAHNEGVMKSDDGGESWTNLGLERKGITTLRVSSGRLIATTENGIYIMEEAGNWRECSEGLESKDITGLAVDPYDDMHWFSADENNIYESINGGESWDVIHTKESAGLTTGKFMAVHFNKAKDGEQAILYIVCASQTYSLRYSTDYGKTVKLPVFDGRETVYLEDNHGWFAEAFRVHSSRFDECMVSVDGELHRGEYKDGELYLYPSASGISGIRASDFAFSAENPNVMFIAAIDRGVIKTVDAGLGENYPLAYNLPFEDRYNIRFNGSKTSKGIAIDPRNENRIICNVGQWNLSVLKESRDGGRSYVELPGTQSSPPRCIEFHNTNPDIIYAGSLISYNNGVTWKKSKYEVQAVSPINSDVVYASSSDMVYVSYNCGVDWQVLNNTTISGMQRITPDNTTEGKVYVGSFLDGLWILTKDIAEHILDENGLVRSAGGRLPIMDIAQNHENPQHLLAGGVDNYERATSAGLFESYDGGKSWHVVDGLTGSKDIWVIEFHPHKKAAYIGTSSGTFVYEYENYFDRSEGYFSDVPAEKEYITILAESGMINGYPDGTYKPENALTRAEFAAFIKPVLVSGSTSMQFNDVDEYAWYYGSVNNAVGAGAMVGYGGFFRPQDSVTHEEALTVFAKLLDFGGVNRKFTLLEAKSSAITENVSDYAVYSVYKCYLAGLIGEGFSFKADKTLTRDEAALLMYRLKGVLRK